jgi:uncharacterized protein YraI
MLQNRKGNLVAAFLLTAMAISFSTPSFANEGGQSSPSPASVICTTTSPNGGRINIRSGAGKAFRVVGTVASRVRINVEGFQEDAEGAIWQKVRVGRTNGWILASFVNCIDS